MEQLDFLANRMNFRVRVRLHECVKEGDLIDEMSSFGGKKAHMFNHARNGSICKRVENCVLSFGNENITTISKNRRINPPHDRIVAKIIGWL
jgi:hypothetical protein